MNEVPIVAPSNIQNLELSDGSGGLNMRDPPTGIAKNQFARLENYHVDEAPYLRKRLGQDLLQNAMIDSVVFTSLADTLALWHFDEATNGPFVDSGPNAKDISATFIGASKPYAVSVLGLFPAGAPLGIRLAHPKFDDDATNLNGCYLSSAATANGMDGQSAMSLEGWINISPSFTGEAKLYTRATTSTAYISDSGAVICGTLDSTTELQPGETLAYHTMKNGVQIFRDWDSTLGSSTSEPYLKFTLSTRGVAGTKTVLTSQALPTSKWIFFCAAYDSATGKATLSINANVHASAVPSGGGVVDDPGTPAIYAASSPSAVNLGFHAIPKVFQGTFDEFRVSSTDRHLSPPAKKGRGNPMILEKADGTLQLVTAAESGLWYTVLDGNWTKIIDTDPAPGVGLMSATADWDGKMIADRLYMTNGFNTPLTWDGQTVVPTGEGVTPLLLTLSATGTTNTDGVHKYVYAYAYGDDVTGFSPPAQITVSGAFDVNVDQIPTRHDNCTMINIYKTKAGGSTYFLDRQIVNDATKAGLNTAGVATQWLTMTGLWTSGGSPDLDAGADGVPDGSTGTNLHDDPDYALVDARVPTTAIRKNKYYLAEHSRLFGCGSEDFPYDVTWSALNNPDVNRALQFTTVAGDRGPLVGMASSHGEIIFSKNGKATTILRGTDESNWELTENIHPTVGARDHWSFVHRYPTAPDDAVTLLSYQRHDDYILCFVGSDGIYAFLLGQVQKISDVINPLFQTLAVNNSTKLDWITTDKVEFQQAASLGGAATQNVQAGTYETDGLREFAGDVRIVNQLDYLGLWTGTGPPTSVSGSVIAVCKGPAEGEFFFATNANRNFYRTTDNFVTASAITTLDALTGTPALVTGDHRIIEITYASIGGVDKYFVFTSATDEQGYVALWNQGPSTAPNVFWENGDTALAGPYFWQCDVPIKFASSVFGDIFTDIPNQGTFARVSYTGYLQIKEQKASSSPSFTSTGQLAKFSDNFHINHAQNVLLSPLVPTDPHFSAIWPEASPTSNGGAYYYSTINDSANPITVSNELWGGMPGIIQTAGFVSGNTALPVGIGFYGIASVVERVGATLRRPDFTFTFTKRETALWQGGTFRPQSFWDSSNSKIVFVGSGAEDANGNRTTSIYSVTALGVLTTAFTAVQSCIAMASDGTYCWYTLQNNTINNGVAYQGYNTDLWRMVQATGVSTKITTAGFLSRRNVLPLRLLWNVHGSKLIAAGKFFLNGANYDNWTYQGIVAEAVQGDGSFSILDSATANGTSGAFPVELAYQTVAPYAIYAAMQNMQATDSGAIWTVPADEPTTGVSEYISPGYESAAIGTTGPVTGILSNLIFVPSSNVIGGNLWADRLYWFGKAALAVDSRMLQLGVPGTWTVIGGLTSKANEIGTISALGVLNVDYAGNISFYFRNAATQLGLAASEQAVTPNQPIQGFSPVGIWDQWRILLTWNYSVANPIVSPKLQVVDLAYYIGNNNIPRIVAEHWLGRTYFSVAQVGQSENNLVLVYNKKNTWELYTGWSIKGMKEFRGLLTALQGYDLVSLESGYSDLGKIIPGYARTGALSNGTLITLDDVQANVEGSVNQNHPTQDGYVKITPYAGEVAGNFPRMLAIPASATGEMSRQFGEPLADFGWDWGGVYSFEIKTSDETSGTFAPYVQQQETIQSLSLKMIARTTGREYTGK